MMGISNAQNPNSKQKSKTNFNSQEEFTHEEVSMQGLR